MTDRTRVLFVNSGILGQGTFSKFVREAMALEPDIDACHMNLSEGLTTGERLIRRALCNRLWRDGWLGVNNLDLFRFRAEYHAGIQAARRMRRLFREGQPDVLHFHRQATAYASVPLMRRIPSVVSIDCTQDIVVDAAASSIERWTYQPNIRADARIFEAAAAVISTSRWAADCVRRRYPSCRAPMHVMPTPVRLQFFPESWMDERRTRAARGARPRVLFVGRRFRAERRSGPDCGVARRRFRAHRRSGHRHRRPADPSETAGRPCASRRRLVFERMGRSVAERGPLRDADAPGRVSASYFRRRRRQASPVSERASMPCRR